MWYPWLTSDRFEEGIKLYGATYDTTEHFWQGVKYHLDVTVADLIGLLDSMSDRDWSQWLKRLDDDPKAYLPNAYAVEFLRHNLAHERLRWFKDELARESAAQRTRPRASAAHSRSVLSLFGVCGRGGGSR